MRTRVTIPRETLEREIGSWIDTTPYIYQTAVIQIVNPQTGVVYDEFNVGLFDTTDLVGHDILGETRLYTKASQHGFSSAVVNE